MHRLIWRGVGVALLAVLAGVAWNAGALIERIAPFDLAAPPGLLTGVQLYLFRNDPQRCFAALDRGKVDYTPAPVRPIEDGCGYEDAAILHHDNVSFGGDVLLRCPALIPLLMWERHVIAPAATEYLGEKVTAVRHYGTYSCRNINHAPDGRRSQHATANAIDVAGFRTASGRAISVARNWHDVGAEGRFLHAVRDGACHFFVIVLTPDYNALHRDHLHLDASRWHVCR